MCALRIGGEEAATARREPRPSGSQHAMDRRSIGRILCYAGLAFGAPVVGALLALLVCRRCAPGPPVSIGGPLDFRGPTPRPSAAPDVERRAAQDAAGAEELPRSIGGPHRPA